MSAGLERFREALDVFGGVVDQVDSRRWDSPSPCAGWTADAVVGHVIHGSRMILAMASQDEPVPPGADPLLVAGDDPRQAWRARRHEIADELTGLDLDACVATPQGTLRVDDGLGQAVVEPLVHAWDLATAVGQPIRLPDHLVVPLLTSLVPLESVVRPSGMFADRRPTAVDATAQDRLLAFLGRTPSR